MTLQEKRQAFLDDTIRYYSEDVSRRAIYGGNCVYLTPDGKRCAIGRFIPVGHESTDVACGVWAACGVDKLLNTYPDALSNEIQSLGIDFLEVIQSLHDIGNNWNAHGLTASGVWVVNAITKNFINK